MTSPLLPAHKSPKGQPIAKPPQSAFAAPQAEASQPDLTDVSSAIVAPQGESHKTSASVAVPRPVPDNEEFLPCLTSSEPEASPSQVVRRVTRQHKEVLVVMSDAEAESPSKSIPIEVRKSLSKQETRTTTTLVGNQIHARKK